MAEFPPGVAFPKTPSPSAFLKKNVVLENATPFRPCHPPRFPFISAMPDLAAIVSAYLTDLAKAANASGSTPELSLRTPLENLFTSTVKSLGRKNQFHLGNENTTPGVKGRPDFILYSHDSPVGYIEAESIDSNIRKLTGSAKTQNDHYSKNLDNFILTNHLDFELWHEGKIIAKASLPDPRSGFSLVSERETLAFVTGTRSIREDQVVF